MRWWTSDLHFSHQNIITYCNRPFQHVTEMNEAIVARWCDQVAPSDEVWVLGDAVMGKLDTTLDVISRLPGIITLVVGNHDRPFKKHATTDIGTGTGAATVGAPSEWERRYLAAGFDRLIHGVTTQNVAGVDVCVCHFPYAGDSHTEDRYRNHRPHDCGMTLIHGHVHDLWRRNGRMINVGIDAWGGSLVSDDTLAQMVASAAIDPTGTMPPIRW